LALTATLLLHLLLHPLHLLLTLAHLLFKLFTLLVRKDLFDACLEQDALGRHFTRQIAELFSILADCILVIIRADLAIQLLLQLLDLLLCFLDITLHLVEDATDFFLLLIREIDHLGELINLIALRLTHLLCADRKRHCQRQKGGCKEFDRFHRNTPVVMMYEPVSIT